MKKVILLLVTLIFSASSSAAEANTPTERVKAAVEDILAIAQDNALPSEQKYENLGLAIKSHVDLQAASQRVIAKHWRKATKEQKIEFMGLFRQVLTNTYGKLLETYTNEEVRFENEKIKKEKYASVDTIVISGGKQIPVTYQLLKRGENWKIYDFVAEGISLVRSYSTDYQSVLRKGGIESLNKQLADKLAVTE
jgi:phospholipid transport system substrate-binding protein